MTSKFVVFFTTIFLSITLQGQDCIVKVVDEDLGIPLAFSYVSINDTTVTSTDEKGIVQIDCSKNSATIVVDYIGYKSLSVKLTDEDLNRDTIIIKLKYSSIVLDEVEVRSSRLNISGEKIIKEAISKIPLNYVSNRVNLQSQYLESVFVNDSLYSNVDSEISISYLGYPINGYVKKSFKNYYRNGFTQAYPSIDTIGKWLPFGNAFFFKYYTSIEDSVMVKSIKVEDRDFRNKYRFTTNGGPLGLLALDKVKYLSDFLDRKLIEKYSYSVTSAIETENGIVYIISFKPNMLFRVKGIPWDEKVKYPVLSGKIYVRKDNYIIEKIECQFANNDKLFGYQINEPWQMFPSSTSLEVIYSGENKSMAVENIRVVQKFKANSSVKWKYSDDFKVIRELNVVKRDSGLLLKKGFHYEDLFRANFRDVDQFLN